MLEQLLPAAVAPVEAFHDIPGEQCFAGEDDLIAHAMEHRRREFVTARRCAREALQRIGHRPAAIRRGPHREPQWPAGVSGSITHCTGYRAAAVARTSDVAGLGIDAEPHGRLPDGVAATVASQGELRMLAELGRADPAVHWDRLLFSAKESVYKAWFPLTRRRLGLRDARLCIDPATGTFTARLSVDGARVDGSAPLRELHGRYLITRRLVLTAVLVPGTNTNHLHCGAPGHRPNLPNGYRDAIRFAPDNCPGASSRIIGAVLETTSLQCRYDH